MTTKECNTCKEVKGVEDFYKRSDLKEGTGLSYQCKKCELKRKRDVKKNAKPMAILNKRKYYIKKHYGMTLDDLRDLLDKQKGVCAICKTDLGQLDRIYSIDHCHDSGEVRGLLCNKCNIKVGWFECIEDEIPIYKEYLNDKEI